MKTMRVSRITIIIILVIVSGMTWSIVNRFRDADKQAETDRSAVAVPVEAVSVNYGPIEQRRLFSGTLEPGAEFVISPKVTGRVERLYVDLGDTIEKGQVVAELENDEYVQAVALAEADLMVAEANLKAAKNALKITARELARFETLRARGVASDSQYDAAKADQLSKEAGQAVALAQVASARALLETARIKLGYTRIAAEWTDGDASRVVSERYVDEGETVSANSPLFSIVSLDPIVGVIFVTEKDYGRLKPGQAATLVTDAYADSRFNGRINRISPVFGQATRQAKIELEIDNPDYLLKPGMFIRVTVTLTRIENAVIIPQQALTRRDDRTGVFILNEDSQTVSWKEVRTGIYENGRVSVTGLDLAGPDAVGRVVTLGQQLLDHGSEIIVTNTSGARDRLIFDSGEAAVR